MTGFSEFLPFIGVVENNVDERLEGRVQVRAFGFHGNATQVPTENLPWAVPISGAYDPNVPVPPLNSWVFGFFLDGRDAQQPMLLGLIPTQYTVEVNPEVNGYGRIDTTDYNVKAQGFRPQDFGQPQNSLLARGESLERTYLMPLEATKVTDVVSASGVNWSEPGSAYNAQYPYNRVIETAGGHSIELDDTPGSERIMIYHPSGSYMQIDNMGTTTAKATSDKYDINESNMHVYIGGKCDVTIMGDAYVRVEGSKLEEVMGDYKKIVHGNYDIDVGGYTNINTSDEVQIRGARVAVEGKVEDVSIMAGKNFYASGGTTANLHSPQAVNIQGAAKTSIKSSSVNIEGEGSANIKSAQVKIGGGEKVSLNASVVALDDVVQMANGQADAPEAATNAISATGTQMSEPTSKSISGMGNMSNTTSSSRGVINAASREDFSDVSSFTSDCSTDLIDALISHEGFSPTAYRDVSQWSIGYGIRTDNPNEVIDEAEAKRRLSARVASDRASVKSYGQRHGYNWNDCQVDALTSFVYNLGMGSLEQVTASGSRTNDQIASKMLEFNRSRDKNGRKVVNTGLVRRRNDESSWFKSGSGIKDDPIPDDDVMI